MTVAQMPSDVKMFSVTLANKWNFSKQVFQEYETLSPQVCALWRFREVSLQCQYIKLREKKHFRNLGATWILLNPSTYGNLQ
jgi:hypothetical protein